MMQSNYVSTARGTLLSALSLFTITSCSSVYPAKVSLQTDYVATSSSNMDLGIEVFKNVDIQQINCASLYQKYKPDKNTEAITSVIGAITLVIEPIVQSVVNQTVQSINKELKRYTNETTFLYEYDSSLAKNCMLASYTFKRNSKEVTEPVFVLRIDGAKNNDRSYGVRVKPLWFNPLPFMPEKVISGKLADTKNVAIAVSMTPIYYLNHERKIGATYQLLSAKFPIKAMSGNKTPVLLLQGADYSKQLSPIMPAPPKRQISSFRFHIATAADAPKLLKIASDLLTKNKDQISEELSSTLEKLINDD